MEEAGRRNSPLLALPLEILVHILEQLPLGDLLNCKRVCQFLHHLVEDTVALQYKVELAAAGMEDGPYNPMSMAEKMSMVKGYSSKWCHGGLQFIEQVAMLDGPAWELYGGVLAQTVDEEGKFDFRQLPSRERNIDARHWQVDTHIPIVDFTVDPAQNLIFGVEKQTRNALCYAQLLNMSTGRPHEDAARPRLLFRDTYFNEPEYQIRIAGDYAAILGSYRPGQRALKVWNWRSGERMLSFSGTETGYSFAFLDNRHLILVEKYSTIAASPHASPAVIYMVDYTESRTVFPWSLNEHHRFFLPAVTPSWRVFDVEIVSEPAPMWQPCRALKVPFQVASKDRVVLIRMDLVDEESEEERFERIAFYIPSERLLSYHATAGSRHSFSWEDWGPLCSVLMRKPLLSVDWPCSVYGRLHVQYREPEDRVALFTLPCLQVSRDITQAELAMSERELESREQQVTSIAFDPPIRSDAFSRPISQAKLMHSITCLEELELGEGEEAVMISEDSIITVNPEDRYFRIFSL